MTEFVTWAITVWPILLVLVEIGLLASIWVIRYDFKEK